MVIEASRPEYAGDIAIFLANAFPESIRELTIYGCPGISNYVEAQIRARHCGADTLYTVALDESRVVGCVEMRRLPRELCLNYIAVASANRVQGLGRRLLKAALDAPECHAYQTLSLDVFDSNQIALRWYQRLGFQLLHTSDWYVITHQQTTEAREGFLVGYPQAEAVHDRFGFSQFRLVTSQGDYSVGRLGSKWFRLTQTKALSDEELCFSLARLDATRGVFLIARQGKGDVAQSSAEKRVTSLTMSVCLQEALSRLGDLQ